MFNWKLYVPTYMRPQPKILDMLKKDDKLKMTFVVRDELYSNGYYDHLKNVKNLDFLAIGSLQDLGDTRKEIMIHAIQNKIKYCVMFDDCLNSLINEDDETMSISECIDNCCRRLEDDPLKEYAIMFEFYRKSRHYSKRPLDSKYFLENPIQAFIINVPLAHCHDINFHTKKIVGVEDEAFFAETLQHGLITCSNSKFVIDGDLPGVKKQGGDHYDDDFENEDKLYDELEARRLAYNGHMFGVYQTKRYRRTIGHCITCTQFDLDYFNRVLVEKRDLNQTVINNQFKIKT